MYCANSFCCSLVNLFANNPLAPCPINAGVLGIQRTSAAGFSNQSSSCATFTPAATETNSLDESKAFISKQTVFINCGFTAKTIASAIVHISLADDGLIPVSSARYSSLTLSISLTKMVAGALPDLIRPRIMLLAMFPAPIKPMILSFKLTSTVHLRMKYTN